MNEAWIDRYLALLGLERDRPGRELLARITAAQFRVPFENVTSMIRRLETPEGPVPRFDFDELLAAWEHGRGGGVCYEQSGMLCNLLRSLGFNAAPIHGSVAFPGSHQAVLVRLDGRRYMVDCGNAAPFLDPIILDQESIVERAGLSFRFRHEAEDVIQQDRLIDGEWRQFCRYDLREVSREELDEAFQRHHRLPAESFVVSELRVVKTVGDDLLQLTNYDFTRHTAQGKTKRRLESDADFVALLRDEFELPNLPILEGLQALQRLSPS
jgi:N-hydroxyarylamine O-acetyltransferase